MRAPLLCAALVLCPAAASGQPTQAIRLEIRVTRPQTPLGSSVPVTVRVVPVSDAAREVLARRGFEPVKLVVSRGGRTLPDVAPSSLSTELDVLRRARVRPALGGALELDTDLAYWAPLDRPGRYDVVVEFAPGTSDRADAGFAPARSPGITIQIQPRPAAELTKHVGDLARRLPSAAPAARTETIRALGATRSREALAPLLGLLSQAGEPIRWVPAALGLLPDRAGVVAAVRTAFARGASAPAVEVLLAAGDSRAALVQAAMRAVGASSPQTRRNGAEALAVLARRAAPADRGPLVDALLGLAGDADPNVRLAVVFGVERVDEPRALAALEAAGRDGSATVRAAAVRALRERRARAALTALLTFPGTDRLEVARAIAVLPEPEARRTLVQCLASRDMALRLSCAQALWEVDDRAGKGVLLAALRSRDDDLRARLIDWLTVVTGRAEAATGVAELSVAWTRWLQQTR